jgi:hypothetical protein
MNRCSIEFLSSLSGLSCQSNDVPALKRWAIFVLPSSRFSPMLIDCAEQIRFKETSLVHFNQLGNRKNFMVQALQLASSLFDAKGVAQRSLGQRPRINSISNEALKARVNPTRIVRRIEFRVCAATRDILPETYASDDAPAGCRRIAQPCRPGSGLRRKLRNRVATRTCETAHQLS